MNVTVLWTTSEAETHGARTTFTNIDAVDDTDPQRLVLEGLAGETMVIVQDRICGYLVSDPGLSTNRIEAEIDTRMALAESADELVAERHLTDDPDADYLREGPTERDREVIR